MKVKVTGITAKEAGNGNPYTRIEWQTASGATGGVSVFESHNFVLGKSYEVELEKKGKYNNLVSAHEVEDMPEPPPQDKQGGRSYGKSPETVQYERASIEFNNAMSETGLCVREGKAPQDIETAYWGHLRRLLSRQPNAPQPPHDGQGVASASNPIPTGIPQPRTSRDDADELNRNFEGTVALPDDEESDARAALLRVGEALKWTGNVSTGDGKIRPGKEWWEKFAQVADIGKVEVALTNARKLLEEKANGD